MSDPDERPVVACGCLRSLAWRGMTLVVLVGLSGCQSPAAPFDPFVGRTTIPPPGTAVPAAAPYDGAAPPVISVPGATTIYPAPGITPVPVPASSLPPAGSGRFPRGITLPQTSTQRPRDGAQLAGWQPAEPSESSDLRKPATTASSNDKPAVVRASHEVSSPERPIRIVEPTPQSAGTR